MPIATAKPRPGSVISEARSMKNPSAMSPHDVRFHASRVRSAANNTLGSLSSLKGRSLNAGYSGARRGRRRSGS